MGNANLEFDDLRTRSPGDLQLEWQRRLGTAPPKLPSSDVMARMRAWRVHERAHGGLDPDVKARLRRLAKDPNPDSERPKRIRPSLSPGTTLVREWQAGHTFCAKTDGSFYVFRLIYTLYLELKSVTALAAELKRRNIRSKVTITRKGERGNLLGL